MVGPTRTGTSKHGAKGVPIPAGVGGLDIVAVSRSTREEEGWLFNDGSGKPDALDGFPWPNRNGRTCKTYAIGAEVECNALFFIVSR